MGLPCTQGYTARVHRFEEQLELERGRTEAARSAGASATSQEVRVCTTTTTTSAAAAAAVLTMLIVPTGGRAWR